MIWWADFEAGDSVEIGRHTFTQEEIVAFARQYDPQAFHVDPEAAQSTVRGPRPVLVKHRWEAVNQHGELVLTMEGWGLFGRKD